MRRALLLGLAAATIGCSTTVLQPHRFVVEGGSANARYTITFMDNTGLVARVQVLNEGFVETEFTRSPVALQQHGDAVVWAKYRSGRCQDAYQFDLQRAGADVGLDWDFGQPCPEQVGVERFMSITFVQPVRREDILLVGPSE